MSYRNAGDSLRAQRERIASDLAAARTASEEALQRAKQVNVLEKELSQIDQLLASMAGRSTLPLLDNVRIAAPCKADWDEMVGDARVRLCAHCEKNVYNLSAMARDEAEAFLVEQEGSVCVRLYKRHDGTVLTNDCPVGVRRRRRRRLAIAGLGGGLTLMAAAAAVGAQRTVTMGLLPPTMGELPRSTMGARTPTPLPPQPLRPERTTR